MSLINNTLICSICNTKIVTVCHQFSSLITTRSIPEETWCDPYTLTLHYLRSFDITLNPWPTLAPKRKGHILILLLTYQAQWWKHRWKLTYVYKYSYSFLLNWYQLIWLYHYITFHVPPDSQDTQADRLTDWSFKTFIPDQWLTDVNPKVIAGNL